MRTVDSGDGFAQNTAHAIADANARMAINKEIINLSATKNSG